jgi:phenylacetate-CoA ligase
VGVYPELTEDERFPIITDAGRSFLRQMRQHPDAPEWNWPNGEQLDEAGLQTVQAFADELERSDGRAFGTPSWLDSFAEFCHREVPFYRNRARLLGSVETFTFDAVPSCDREDLAPRVWDFVPDSKSLDNLIVFSTSGTTGHPTRMLSSPATAACGVPLIERALKREGIGFPRGVGQVAMTNVAAYRGAYTTAILVSYLREAGCVRVNLDASAWRSPDQCARYINHWRAPIWLGDPLAFRTLETIETDHAPKAIVSSIMHLAPAQANDLRARYGCPVFDLYAMTEVGILAVGTPQGHEVLPHDVHVEILDDDGRPLPDGQRGEIAVTSARNPFMPLLRYRTGDRASLARVNGQRYLIDLEGRAPQLYSLPSGRIVHSMEVTRLMRQHPLLQYRLHQDASGGFRFGFRGLIDARQLERQLRELLEQPEELVFEELDKA